MTDSGIRGTPVIKKYRAGKYFLDDMEFAIRRGVDLSSEFNPSVRFQREFWKITFIRQGSGRVLINDHDYPIAPGSIFLVHPNAVTTYSMDSDSLDLCNILFSLNFIKSKLEQLKDNYDFFKIFTDSFDPYGGADLYVQKSTPAIERRVFELVAEYESLPIDYEQYLACGLTMLLIQMMRLAGKSYHGRASAKNVTQYVHHLLRSDLRAERSTRSLAAFFGITPTHLCLIFKSVYGITISQARVRYRLQEAEKLLRSTDLPVGEVCIKCGFRDLSYFHRAFRKQYGMTPLAFKKED